MKIAYIMYPGACYMGAGDGSKMQAVIWADELRRQGHEVEQVNPWGHYDWKAFDIVHVFGFGLWNYDIIHWGSRLNPNFVFSPIIDTNTPMWKYRLATHFGCEKLRLFSQNYILRKLKPDVKMFFARTDYEASYFREGYGIGEEKISIIPLSYRSVAGAAEETANSADGGNFASTREPFCMFAGTMTQERKNVGRLIDAARKYGFRLVLVGNTGNQQSLAALKERIGGAENIEIKGFVSDEELKSLYSRAKVFALPSLNEGVGLVALEAAIQGCNIVITNLGGPKEYYPKGMARLVNPYDIDDIGRSINEAMTDDTQQPALAKHIRETYSVENCVRQLVEAYKKAMTN